MNKVPTTVLLASASPRRKQLLEQLGWPVVVRPVDIDENPRPAEAPRDYCWRMAEDKARSALHTFAAEQPIIAADTIVVLAEQILGKPANPAQAVTMLRQLSGRSHQVLSAVSLVWQGQLETALSVNTVHFAELNDELIGAYVASGEPMDKAGAYGIQGQAASWISHIEGSYSAIMGLPLFETSQLLRKGDIISPLDVLKASYSG